MRFDVRAGLLLIALVSLFVGLISSTFQKSFNGKRLEMTVSPNGDRVATFSGDGHLHVVDLNAASWMYQEKDVSERVKSNSDENVPPLSVLYEWGYSPSFKFVDQDKVLVVFIHLSEEPSSVLPDVYVWDLNYRSIISKFPDLVSESTCSNGTFLGVVERSEVGKSNSVEKLNSVESFRLVESSTGRLVEEFRLHERSYLNFRPQMRLTLSDDSSTLVCQSIGHFPRFNSIELDGRIDVYDVNRGLLAGASTVDDDAVVISRTGRFLLAGQDDYLRLFNQNIDPIGNFGIYSELQAHFSSDEKLLAFQKKLGAPIKILDIEKRKVISTIEVDEDCLFQFSTVNNNLIVLSAEGELNLRIFDSTDGFLIRKFGVDRRRSFFIYSIGFAIWSLAFGWLYPSRKRRHDRTIIESSPGVADDIEIPVAQASAIKTPWAIYCIWGLMLVSGVWGIGYSVYVIVDFEAMWPFFSSAWPTFFEKAYWFTALCSSLGVAAVALSRAIWFRPELLRVIAILQMVLLLACDVPAFFCGAASFCLTFVPSANFYLKQKRDSSS